jgi:hypothetical protein
LKVIVSLTSYPARIETVHLTVKNLLNQTEKIDKIILWLAKEQFANREESLPKNLLDLTSKGLTIGWCENDIKSYKKLIPAIKEFPDDIIITVDDDAIYNNDIIRRLLISYKNNPNCITAHRITRLYIRKDKFFILQRGLYYKDANKFNYSDYLKKPSYFNKLTGCGGVLYPPGCLHPDVLSEKIFMELAPTSDDIWFWLMGVRNGTRVCVPDDHISIFTEIAEAQKESLSDINDHGEKLFFVHLYNVINHYPDILQKINIDKEMNDKIVKTLKNNIPNQIRCISTKMRPDNMLKHLKDIFDK